MSQEYTSLNDMFVEHFEDVARSAQITQTVHGGQQTALKLSEAEQSARRETLWNDFSARYPEVVRSQPVPPIPPQHNQLDRVDIDTGPIAFNNGVPVGGFAHLALFSDGTYSFTGHFHVSGAPSYNVALAIVVADSQGRPISFGHSGRVHGTFESGSRDDDWAATANEPMISQLWGTQLGSSWRWTANVNIDVQAMINSTIQAAGYVAAVAAVIA